MLKSNNLLISDFLPWINNTLSYVMNFLSVTVMEIDNPHTGHTEHYNHEKACQSCQPHPPCLGSICYLSINHTMAILSD